jgi:hypothetical protein
MAELRVVAPAPDIQMIWQVLTILAGATDTTPVTDPRPIGARRVDALTRLCLEAVAPTPTPTPAPASAPAAAEPAGDLVRLPRRPHIPTQAHIVVDLPTLAGLANHPAELVGYGPVPADIARAWLTDATSWRRLVTDPATDQLIDLGPVVYRPPPGLDAYIRARDRTCTFPFCHQPAHRCDLDHAQPHQADGTGGHTSAHNLGALCRYHHRIKTFMGWTPHIQPDRTVIWESPTGRTYHTHPPQQAA